MKDYIQKQRSMHEDMLSGKITGLEYLVIDYLYHKANIYMGRASVDNRNISHDLDEFFNSFKDPVNKVNKVMLSLKKKRRIWFEKRSGSRGKAEVFISGYPCRIDKQHNRPLNITNKFEEYCITVKNTAEVGGNKQRFDEHESNTVTNNTGRGVYTRLDKTKLNYTKLGSNNKTFKINTNGLEGISNDIERRRSMSQAEIFKDDGIEPLR